MSEKLVGIKLLKVYNNGRTELIELSDLDENLKRQILGKENMDSRILDTRRAREHSLVASSPVLQVMSVLEHTIEQYIKNFNNGNKLKSINVITNDAIKVSSEEIGVCNMAIRDKITRTIGINKPTFNKYISNYILIGDTTLLELLLDKYNKESHKYIEEMFNIFEEALNSNGVRKEFQYVDKA